MTRTTKGIISTKMGEFTFEYYLSYSSRFKSDAYFFYVWKEGIKSKGLNKFSFILRIMENGNDLKVVDLIAGDYKGNGISIPIILKSKELFGKRIISSSNKIKSFNSEANWQDAIDRVWKPMVNQGLAKHDASNDYYYVL